MRFLKDWGPLLRPLALLGLLFIFGGAGEICAQSLNEGSRLVEAKISLKSLDIDDRYVLINYEIPYSGIVEFRLFDSEGEKIWQNQYINSYGENKIILKKAAFTPGDIYAYTINYKKDQIKGELVVDY